MEGNMLYHKYLKPMSEYYGEMEISDKAYSYELDEVPDTYTVVTESDSVWKYYHFKGELFQIKAGKFI